MFTIFWYLLVGHAICDYPLQGDFLARGKNHTAPIQEIPWYICLVAHALIHGGAVSLITQDIWIGVAEFVVHAVIDYGKCDNWYGFKTDQILHVVCKLIWIVIITY